MRKSILMFASLLAFSGCSEIILSNQENASGAIGMMKSGSSASLREASNVAHVFSDAYLTAARRAMRSQDFAAAGAFVAGGALVAGAVGSASDVAQTNRALAGVGLQQTASRGVSRKSIEAMLKGASSLNCVSTVANVFSAAGSSVVNSPIAVQLTYGVIREIRINVRSAFVQDVLTVSSIMTAYKGIIENIPGPASQVGLQEAGRLSRPNRTELETYYKRLAGCVSFPPVAVPEQN